MCNVLNELRLKQNNVINLHDYVVWYINTELKYNYERQMRLKNNGLRKIQITDLTGVFMWTIWEPGFYGIR